jgi:chemotaxis protein MotB
MSKLAWFTVFLLLLVAGLAGFGLYAWDKLQEQEQLRTALGECAQVLEQQVAQRAVLQRELAEQLAMINALQREKERALKAHDQLETEMRQALQSRDVTISELQGNVMVDILDRILFDSGQAELKGEGQELLRKIAGILDQYPDRKVHVIGHTDNVPIRANAWSRYPTNWELSTARATAAVRFLVEQAGVDPARFAAVGFGEHHPVADNSTAGGRARNRRIALMVLPSQFNPYARESEPAAVEGEAGADQVPAGSAELPGEETAQFLPRTP